VTENHAEDVSASPPTVRLHDRGAAAEIDLDFIARVTLNPSEG
jgi:hypothetical protein